MMESLFHEWLKHPDEPLLHKEHHFAVMSRNIPSKMSLNCHTCKVLHKAIEFIVATRVQLVKRFQVQLIKHLKVLSIYGIT